MKIHFIGIGGVSMSSLAKYMLRLGYDVSGSDIKASKITEELSFLGVKVFIGHNENNVDNAEVVVYSSAITKDNAEYVFSKNMGKLLLERIELLNYISRSYKNRICVSGSHGKSSVTAMLTHIFSCKNCTSHIGAIDKKYQNLKVGDKDYFITEACEYKKNFLRMSPTVAVILNVDKDHLECYRGEEDLINSFALFGEKSSDFTLVNIDDERSKKVKEILDKKGKNTFTFSAKNSADFTAKNIEYKRGFCSFDFYKNNRKMGRINLSVLGEYNLYNALAGVSVGVAFKLPFNLIKQSMENFHGIARRMEKLKEVNGVKIYTDYAHHPKEIKVAIDTIKNSFDSDRAHIIFQPHTYSRTRLLLKEFVKVFEKVNNLAIYKTYPARESYDKLGSAMTLHKSVKSKNKNATYLEDDVELINYYQNQVKSGDVVFLMGAGDINEKANLLN